MLDTGGAYSGGFPEVFFELFGPVTAFPVLFVTGWVIATLYLVFMRAILQRRYVRSALCWYVLYAFVILVFGGMLNFLVNWKFWLKAGTLVAWILFERERDRQHADSPATATA